MDRQKERLLVVLLLSLAGVVASVYLADLHYRLVSGTQVQGSFCALSEVVDCDAVTASTYAEVLNVPLASFGAIVYLVCVSFSLFGIAIGGMARYSARFVFVIALMCVLFDVYLAFIGFALLKKICLVCIFTWAVNFGILYFSFKGSEGGPGEIVRSVIRECRGWVTGAAEGTVIKRLHLCTNGVIVFFSIVIIALIRIHYLSGPEEIAAKIIETFRGKTPVQINVEHAPRLGNPKARVRIVEFSDFRCPYCKKLSQALQMTHRRFPEDVVIFFKHYPLDRECNKHIEKTAHVEACNLARMAICAQSLERFWKLEDLFFTSDKHFMNNLESFFGKGSTDFSKFMGCLSEQETMGRLSGDIEDAQASGVELVPTFFVNGYRVVGYYDPMTLSVVIEEMLTRPRP